jgi:hypothetical protein
MASIIHEATIGGFDRVLTRQLFIIEQSNDQVAADFARDVHAWRSPKTDSVDGGIHYPDSSFGHKATPFASCILEVSYSQKRRDLPKLADEYIRGSNGRTQIVIGIDLEYQKDKGKEARVIVWRPKDVEEDGEIILKAAQTEEGIFRAADGSLVDGKRILRIRLKDFGNRLDYPGIDDITGEITISFTQLYEIVQESEAITEIRKRRRGSDEVLAGRRMRPRVRPSPEELASSDEERVRVAEEEVENQVNDQDGDYTP